jgi:cell division protein FtsB
MSRPRREESGSVERRLLVEVGHVEMPPAMRRALWVVIGCLAILALSAWGSAQGTRADWLIDRSNLKAENIALKERVAELELRIARLEVALMTGDRNGRIMDP